MKLLLVITLALLLSACSGIEQYPDYAMCNSNPSFGGLKAF